MCDDIDVMHLFDLTETELGDAVADLGLARFRGRQVLDWVYQKGVSDFAMMKNISKADRQTLADHLQINTASTVAHQTASDGVEKLLMRWPAGGETECVMIPTEKRRTACISSQVGCPVGCTFCASGLGGLEGNLTAGCIVQQVWQLGRLEACGLTREAPTKPLKPHTSSLKPITHVVFMGMGEPLANFDAVTKAVRILTADWGLNISARRITISTVGLPAPIRRLADVQIPVTLAISLHAPNDDLRQTLIPWAQYTSIEELIAAARYYFGKTGREITLEYILLRQVNDRPKHARQLANVAKQLRSNVNLIRYNEVKGLPFDRPTTDDVHAFQKALRDAGVNAHIRASRGRDIAAACGQLRHEQSA